MPFKKGHIPWNKNKSLSEKHKNHISETVKKWYYKYPEKSHKCHQFIRINNPMKIPEIARKSAETNKKLYMEGKRKLIKYWLGKKHSEETKEKIRKTKILQYKDPNSIYNSKEWNENRIRNSLKGLMKRPTSLERRFIEEIIIPYNFSLNYCGDGSLLIGFKNPDFVESNGNKKCVEIANEVELHHPKGWDTIRINHFKKYGWDCLIIWESELKNKHQLLEKVQRFLS